MYRNTKDQSMFKRPRVIFALGLTSVVAVLIVLVTQITPIEETKGDAETEKQKRFIPNRGSVSRERDETVGRTRIRAGSRTTSESSDLEALRLESYSDENHIDKKRKMHTFFSIMPKSFINIRLPSDEGIPVTTFLDACRAILPIFDKLNPTAFAPVKLDVAGNIRKIQQKYSSNPKQFRTLQAMVQYEIKANQHKMTSSATEALTWLKRALEFIKEFLTEFLGGEEDLGAAASNAYSKTLHDFHGWVVRGVFALAMKALPYRAEFIKQLASSTADIDDPQFENLLTDDIKLFTKHLTETIDIINEFYVEYGLDPNEV